MSNDIKIGDSLWCNERYGKGWKEYAISGETAQSWLVGDINFRPIKINKKTMLESLGKYGSQRWFTFDQKVKHDWETTHRWRIEKRVGTQDYDVLKQIAALIGYDENKA